MAKKKPMASVDDAETKVMETSITKAKEQTKVPIEEMPLNTLRDYRQYNEEARRLNKMLRICRYPIKQCPADLHPKQRVKFGNNDQSMNPVSVHVSDHMIHFDEKLTPGKIYDLPEYIVHYLSEKGYPIWDWVNLSDGSRETRCIGKKPRFSLTSIYQESYA